MHGAGPDELAWEGDILGMKFVELADMGASVVRVDRAGPASGGGRGGP